MICKHRKNRKAAAQGGFTLIEVVVSLAILAVLVIGFSQIMLGNIRITTRGFQYDESTYNFTNVIETLNNAATPTDFPEGMAVELNPKTHAPISFYLANLNAQADVDAKISPANSMDDHRLPIDYWRFYYPDDPVAGSFYYFVLPAPAEEPEAVVSAAPGPVMVDEKETPPSPIQPRTEEEP